MDFLRTLFGFDNSENTLTAKPSTDDLLQRQESQTPVKNQMNDFQYLMGAYTNDYRELFKHNYDTVEKHYIELDEYCTTKHVVKDIQSIFKLLTESRLVISNCMKLMNIQEDVLIKQQGEITSYSERVEVEKEKCKNKECRLSVLKFDIENLVDTLEYQKQYYKNTPSNARTIIELDEKISLINSNVKVYRYLLSLRSNECDKLRMDFSASERALKEIINKKCEEVQILTSELENTKSRFEWQKQSSAAQIADLEENKCAVERKFVDRIKEMSNEINTLNVELAKTKSKLVSERTSMMGKIDESDAAVRRMNDENEELKTELKHARSEIQSTRNCLKNLRSVNIRVLEKIKFVKCDTESFKSALRDLETGIITNDDDVAVSKRDASVRKTNQVVAREPNIICTSTECEEKQIDADKCIVQMVGRCQKLKQVNAVLKSKIKRVQTSSKSVEIVSQTTSRSTISVKSESSHNIVSRPPRATKWNSGDSDTGRGSHDTISEKTLQRNSNESNSDRIASFPAREPHRDNITDENGSFSIETNCTISNCSVTTFSRKEKSEKNFSDEYIANSDGFCFLGKNDTSSTTSFSKNAKSEELCHGLGETNGVTENAEHLREKSGSDIEPHVRVTNESRGRNVPNATYESSAESLKQECMLKVIEYNNSSEEFNEIISSNSKEIEFEQNEITNCSLNDNDAEFEILIRAKYCNPQRKEILESKTELESNQSVTLRSNVNKETEVDKNDSNILSVESKSSELNISKSEVEIEFEKYNNLFDYPDQQTDEKIEILTNRCSNPQLQEETLESIIKPEGIQKVTSNSNGVTEVVDKKDLELQLSVESKIPELKISKPGVEIEFERNKAGCSAYSLDHPNQQADEEIETSTHCNPQQEEILESIIKPEGVRKVTSRSNTDGVTVVVDEKPLKLLSVESKIPELKITSRELLSPCVESKNTGNVQNAKKKHFLSPRFSNQGNISMTKSKCKIQHATENQSAVISQKMMSDLFESMQKDMTQAQKDNITRKKLQRLLNPTDFDKYLYTGDEWWKPRC